MNYVLMGFTVVLSAALGAGIGLAMYTVFRRLRWHKRVKSLPARCDDPEIAEMSRLISEVKTTNRNLERHRRNLSRG